MNTNPGSSAFFICGGNQIARSISGWENQPAFPKAQGEILRAFSMEGGEMKRGKVERFRIDGSKYIYWFAIAKIGVDRFSVSWWRNDGGDNSSYENNERGVQRLRHLASLSKI